MSTAHPLHGWKDAWRVYWSFLWRQAIALFLGAAALGLVLALLKRAGAIGPRFLFDTMGFTTTLLYVASGFVAFKLLLSKYDIRRHGR